MRRRIAIGLVLFLCLVAGGCSTIDLATIQALETSWTVIAEEYAAYVEADPALREDQRARRLEHAAEHTALLDELLERYGGAP